MPEYSIAGWQQRFARLSSDRHFRDTQQRLPVEGIRSVVTASDAGFVFEAIIYSRCLMRSAAGRSFLRDRKASGTPVIHVSADDFRKLNTMKRASGLAAIVVQEQTRLTDLVPRSDDFFVAVSRLRSPGNLGSIVRTAAAAGAAGFILIGQSVDPFDARVIRASMGAVFRQKFLRCRWSEFASWKQQHRVHATGLCPSGKASCLTAEWNGPSVLMLGEERRGLSSRQRKYCDRFLRIPMTQQTDSLNAAVAGSIVLYEIAGKQGLV